MLLFILIFTSFARSETWVDENGQALYLSREHCQKYAGEGVGCFETDKDFDKDFYILFDGKFVKDTEKEKEILTTRKAKEDSVKNQKQEISLLKEKIKTQKLSDEEIKKILIFLLGKLGE